MQTSLEYHQELRREDQSKEGEQGVGSGGGGGDSGYTFSRYHRKNLHLRSVLNCFLDVNSPVEELPVHRKKTTSLGTDLCDRDILESIVRDHVNDRADHSVTVNSEQHPRPGAHTRIASKAGEGVGGQVHQGHPLAVLDIPHYGLLHLHHPQHLAGLVNVLQPAKPRDHVLEGLLVHGDVLQLHHLQHIHIRVDSP